MSKRIFLIVLDSFGIGEAPDAADFGDEGSNTLAACRATGKLSLPHLDRLGLFQIDGVDAIGSGRTSQGAFGRMREASRGKDTTRRALGDCRGGLEAGDADVPTWVSNRNAGRMEPTLRPTLVM